MTKHVLITGGNKGIGYEITKQFLALDYKVTIIARNFSNITGLENCNLITFD